MPRRIVFAFGGHFAGSVRMSSAGSNRHGKPTPPTDHHRNGKAPAPKGKAVASKAKIMAGHLSFVIDSDLEQGRDVQKQVLQAVRDHGFEGQNYFAITLALEEAVTNAIRHGNRLDKSKKVRVEAKVTQERFEIEIEDEGKGFDRTSVPDPTTAENIEKCSGRGILLIEAYMNSVTWDRGGRRVRMLKLNEPE
jgi:serine/threonine-protein kinase RsbW